MTERRASVARNPQATTAVVTPLTRVKLELGFILLFAVVAWLLAGRWFDAWWQQAGVLALYGLVGMAWLVLRCRQVLQRLAGEAR